MDQISSSNTSSSTSSSSYNDHLPKSIKSTRPSYLNALHSVRKPTHKPITKQFIAPLPPTPPKVYNVKASNFKEVVRVLTSTPEFQTPPVRRLKDIAPPPLILSKIPKPSLFPKPIPPSEGGATVISPLPAFIFSPDFRSFLNETLDSSRLSSKSPVMDYFGGLSPLGLSLSSAPPRVYEPSWVAPMSPLGFNMSPSSLSWCSSMLFSPTTLSAFSQSPIL
ncbi:uncharacterized protein LOC112515857 [Cynara cardunculus var. scolymus]|uniref:uncharacterized protein LOC112515857 n=1 Tax=Cynara cardunculus var. scolymus TaxID=59895 RepID=UPI000D62D4D4|nr:uncharacterized protein LOC112515857 [Cynara cardunculus var. scolymus]